MAKERSSTGTKGDARNRRIIASQYLETAELAATDGATASNNVVVGNAVLAGIAASDAICLAVTGSRYSGEDHAAAARVLARAGRFGRPESSWTVLLTSPAEHPTAAGSMSANENSSPGRGLPVARLLA